MMTIAIGKHKPGYDANLPEEYRTGDGYTFRLSDGQIDDTCFAPDSCRVFYDLHDAIAAIVRAAEGITDAPEGEAADREQFIVTLARAISAAVPKLQIGQLKRISWYLNELRQQHTQKAEVGAIALGEKPPFFDYSEDENAKARQVAEHIYHAASIRCLQDAIDTCVTRAEDMTI